MIMELRLLRKKYPYALSVLKRANELANGEEEALPSAINKAVKEYAGRYKSHPLRYSCFVPAFLKDKLIVATFMTETAGCAKRLSLKKDYIKAFVRGRMFLILIL